MRRANILKKIFIVTLCFGVLTLSFFAPLVEVSAQTSPATTTTTEGAEASVRDLLCTPESGEAATLGGCVNKVVRVGIVIALFAALGVTIWAGYLYMSGEEKKMKNAKHMIIGVGAGLLIILFTFLILQTINPDITKDVSLTNEIDTALITCKVSEKGDKCVELPKLNVGSLEGTNISFDKNGKYTGTPTITCKSGKLVNMKKAGLRVKDANDVTCADEVPYMLEFQKKLDAALGPNGWEITESQGPKHQSACHKTYGTCFDLAIRTGKNSDWGKVCQVLNASKPTLDYLNEVFDGPARGEAESNGCKSNAGRTKFSTGNHLHIMFKQQP